MRRRTGRYGARKVRLPRQTTPKLSSWSVLGSRTRVLVVGKESIGRLLRLSSSISTSWSALFSSLPWQNRHIGPHHSLLAFQSGYRLWKHYHHMPSRIRSCRTCNSYGCNLCFSRYVSCKLDTSSRCLCFLQPSLEAISSLALHSWFLYHHATLLCKGSRPRFDTPYTEASPSFSNSALAYMTHSQVSGRIVPVGPALGPFCP